MVLEGSSIDIAKTKGQYDEKVVRKFKKLVLEMHDGIPQYYFFGLIENLAPEEEIRRYLFDKEIFVTSKKRFGGQDHYFLGVNGMVLANSYKMEVLSENTVRLTSQMKWLTLVVLVLAFFTFSVTLIGFYLNVR